jgi:tRNA 2-thiouridine synthesizing protein A
MTAKAAPRIEKTLDARGLKCPLPVLLAKKALKSVPGGGVLEVLATDRGADADIVDLCEITGAVLLASSFSDGVYRFLMRVGDEARTDLPGI